MLFQGPLPSALKVRGGSPFSQYEMLGSDTLGIQSQGTADNWHRTPGSKMGNKLATSSWPPGWHGLFCGTIWQPLNRIKGVVQYQMSSFPLLKWRLYSVYIWDASCSVFIKVRHLSDKRIK